MADRPDQPQTPAEEAARFEAAQQESEDAGLDVLSADDHSFEKTPDSVRTEGGEETPADGIAPKAGYPKLDPRHDDKPYKPGRQDGVPDVGDDSDLS